MGGRDDLCCTPVITLLSETVASVELLRPRVEWLVARRAFVSPLKQQGQKSVAAPLFLLKNSVGGNGE